jgi:hypothetical protein
MRGQIMTTLEEKHRIQEEELRIQQERERREANERAEQERDRRLADAQAEQERQRRAEAERELEASIRDAFFAGSPSATEEEYQRLLPRLREERLIHNARTDPVLEEAAILADRAPSGFRGTF